MNSIMNEYVLKIQLLSDDIMKSMLQAALQTDSDIQQYSVLSRSNRYIVDIHLKEFSMEQAVHSMNHFMEATRFHYSAYFIRFNEGNLIRYRYASCKEDRSGFYCDVVIS